MSEFYNEFYLQDLLALRVDMNAGTLKRGWLRDYFTASIMEEWPSVVH